MRERNPRHSVAWARLLDREPQPAVLVSDQPGCFSIGDVESPYPSTTVLTMTS